MATGASRIYLDWNATAPLRPAAADAMRRAFDLIGNPSSVHAEGRAARAAIERAREQVGRLVGAPARRVVFTSGGSEANALALTPSIGLGDGKPTLALLMSATEHASVREGHRFAKEAVEEIPVDGNGLVQPDRLAGMLAKPRAGRALVSIHFANNETGVIQSIAEIGLMCRQADALLHVDAVQAAGKIAIDMATLGVDALSMSAHKLGGPKGVGALVLGSDRVEIVDRLVRGGGQERGWRAGTENVPGVVGFGAAAEESARALDETGDRLAALRDELERGLAALSGAIAVFGHGAPRLPNTSCFSAPGLSAEKALILMDLAGVAVSSGSACSSGKVKASHVLAAMGVSPSLLGGALRTSLGWSSTAADVTAFLAAYAKALAATHGRKAEAA